MDYPDSVAFCLLDGGDVMNLCAFMSFVRGMGKLVQFYILLFGKLRRMNERD